MATTQVVLALIATTLIAIALLGWASVYYVPAILSPEGHGDDDHPGGRAS